MHVLLELDCIPSGMELFPAANDSQWELIKGVIDDCDYYVVIIAGRYGTMGPNGVSCTEMEYRYAVEKDKPVVAFLHGDPLFFGHSSTNLSKDMRPRNRPNFNTESGLTPNGKGPAGERHGSALERNAPGPRRGLERGDSPPVRPRHAGRRPGRHRRRDALRHRRGRLHRRVRRPRGRRLARRALRVPELRRRRLGHPGRSRGARRPPRDRPRLDPLRNEHRRQRPRRGARHPPDHRGRRAPRGPVSGSWPGWTGPGRSR